MRFLRSPPVTITQPTCRRSQFERVEMSTAVAMKYSSHEGRCGKLLAASAIRSTGRTGTAASAGVSGVCEGEAETFMRWCENEAESESESESGQHRERRQSRNRTPRHGAMRAVGPWVRPTFTFTLTFTSGISLSLPRMQRTLQPEL